jgi:S-adenosylmethionine synthetase
MNQHAEYVSPGHPDRLADAIAESIVTAALRQRPDALVGVEVAVHTDCVFVDGRIAAGTQRVDIEKIVRDVYRDAGYGGPWKPDPAKIRVTTELCEEVLPAQESDIRPFSDDQNIVIGYACGDERTNYLPVAHWISSELGRRLFAHLRSEADLSATFGPDFKILSSLSVAPGATQVVWDQLILSVQHLPKLSYERQHRTLIPILRQLLGELENEGLQGAASTFTSDKLILNGAGEFAVGGPEGDNGLSGKKLVIDHYGPGVAIGGGALAGKDPHKVDKCGALRARQLAKKLVRKGVDEARVILGWAPGGDAPFLVEASTNHGNVSLQVPREELPPDEWFNIKAIVGDLELTERDWAADLLAGYFCRASVPWESGDPKKSFYSPRVRRIRCPGQAE